MIAPTAPRAFGLGQRRLAVEHRVLAVEEHDLARDVAGALEVVPAAVADEDDGRLGVLDRVLRRLPRLLAGDAAAVPVVAPELDRGAEILPAVDVEGLEEGVFGVVRVGDRERAARLETDAPHLGREPAGAGERIVGIPVVAVGPADGLVPPRRGRIPRLTEDRPGQRGRSPAEGLVLHDLPGVVLTCLGADRREHGGLVGRDRRRLAGRCGRRDQQQTGRGADEQKHETSHGYPLFVPRSVDPAAPSAAAGRRRVHPPTTPFPGAAQAFRDRRRGDDAASHPRGSARPAP